jgi:hypothetical protein
VTELEGSKSVADCSAPAGYFYRVSIYLNLAAENSMLGMGTTVTCICDLHVSCKHSATRMFNVHTVHAAAAQYASLQSTVLLTRCLVSVCRASKPCHALWAPTRRASTRGALAR